MCARFGKVRVVALGVRGGRWAAESETASVLRGVKPPQKGRFSHRADPPFTAPCVILCAWHPLLAAVWASAARAPEPCRDVHCGLYR